MAEEGLKERIKQIFDNGILDEDNLKLARRLIILIFAGVLFLMLGNLADSDESSNFTAINDSQTKVSKTNKTVKSRDSSPETKMEEQLTKVLSNISGVGKVVVDITLKTGPEYRYAKNDDLSTRQTNEETNDGGKRQTEERNQQKKVVIVRNNDGSEEAVTKKKIEPKIKGVVVVAQGAESSYIKADLISAIKTGLGVPVHKIVVLPMKR